MGVPAALDVQRPRAALPTVPDEPRLYGKLRNVDKCAIAGHSEMGVVAVDPDAVEEPNRGAGHLAAGDIEGYSKQGTAAREDDVTTGYVDRISALDEGPPSPRGQVHHFHGLLSTAPVHCEESSSSIREHIRRR